MEVILNYLKTNKRISVEEICNLCGVSRDTARRDLVKLEKNGEILRTHGGAILSKVQNKIKNYEERLQQDLKPKKEVAKLAAALIKSRDRIIMDTSTTMQLCAELLGDIEDCSVITNSINVADILSNNKNVDIHLVGGKLNQKHRYLYGTETISMLSNYYTHKAFIGIGGITKNGIMNEDNEDGFVKRKMIEQAEQVIVLADSTKFGKSGFFKVADLSKIDLIITDKIPDKDFMDIFEENKITVVFP
ncbi:DeoR/GlpR family DNA-binding transcription regulator [Tepidibacter aestuarii]|uniref:DeoR/GlpR family DNA-binding transcription regulator n=1 Tax=Tepidibacter aestuarii TaxID=2925782 RepID=UPI0020BEB159|nr:DeoR/GlpR family DNA-binding transcription regulator [Tepidibacter aestuarii]